MSTALSNIVDEITVEYHPKSPLSKRPKINSSLQAYEILRGNWSPQISIIEEFNILLLDQAHHVLGMSNLSKGGLSSTTADIRVAFMTALKTKSSAMIISHNHPSGSLTPSREDVNLTKKFVEAGKILSINILDHIIVTPDSGYYSFCDECNIIE